jgi:septal ring factor EnvC (AmiA/AmiB activator)
LFTQFCLTLFDFIPTNLISDDLCVKDGSTGSNSSDDIYKKVKTYLNTKQQLKQLESTLKKEEQQMYTDNEEIKRLADDIRKQAEAALVTH